MTGIILSRGLGEVGKGVPEQDEEEKGVGKQEGEQRVNPTVEASPAQPPPRVRPPLFLSPPRLRHAGRQNLRRRLLVRALAPPRSFGEAPPGGPREVQRRECPCEERVFRFGAEEWGVAPAKVTGDLGGNEELRMERWGGGGAGYDVG